MPQTQDATLEGYIQRLIDDLGDYEVFSEINVVNGYALRYRHVHPVPVDEIRTILSRYVEEKRLMVLYPAGITKETAGRSVTYYKRVLPPLRSA